MQAAGRSLASQEQGLAWMGSLGWGWGWSGWASFWQLLKKVPGLPGANSS